MDTQECRFHYFLHRLEDNIREQQANKHARLDSWNELKENAELLTNKLQEQINVLKTVDTFKTRTELEVLVEKVKVNSSNLMSN